MWDKVVRLYIWLELVCLHYIIYIVHYAFQLFTLGLSKVLQLGLPYLSAKPFIVVSGTCST